MGRRGGAARWGGEVERRGRKTVVARWSGEVGRRGWGRWAARRKLRGGSEAAGRKLLGMVAKSLQAIPIHGQLASTRRSASVKCVCVCARTNARERGRKCTRAPAINARVPARTCRCRRCGIDNYLSIPLWKLVEVAVLFPGSSLPPPVYMSVQNRPSACDLTIFFH